MDHVSVVLLLAWVSALVSVSLAYVIAGRFWVVEHCLNFQLNGKEKSVSGVYGEAFLISFIIGLLWIIDRVTNETSLLGLVSDYPVIVFTVSALVIIVILLRGIRTAFSEQTSQGDHAISSHQLALCYTVYTVFSSVIFLAAAAIIVLLFGEFNADGKAFLDGREAILQSLSNMGHLSAEETVRQIDLAYTDVHRTLSRGEDQLTPIFIAAGAAFLLNFFILSTPLKSVFREDAVMVTLILNVLAIIGVTLAAFFMFSGGYSQLVENALDGAWQARPAMETAYWEVTARYNDILQALEERRSFLSFLTGVSNEWGGVAAALGVLQWVSMSMINKEN